MRHDESFLRDVILHPDDDVPRLIYADWLQDHGDPARAEFIRLQIERANPSTDRTRRAALWERERQLLWDHELRWTAPLHGLVQRARFVRGFVEQVFVFANDFLPHAEALFRLAPVRHLILTASPADWGQLMAVPSLRFLTTFELRGTTLDAEEATLLAECPHLPHLRRLILRYATGEETVRVLSAAPMCSRLTALDLYGAYMENEGAQALIHSPYLKGLSYLALGDITEEIDVAQLLADPSSLLNGLEQLYLGWTQIDDEGAQRLAASPKFARLKVLDLMGNRIEMAGARALAEAPHLQALEALYLQGNPLDNRARKRLRARFGDRVLLGG